MGASGPKSAFSKDDPIGTTKGGQIIEWRHTQQRELSVDRELKYWKDGNPMMQLEVTVQTDERSPDIEDDDGVRRLFVKGGMTKAVRAAVEAVKRDMIERGGWLYVQYTGDGVSGGPGLNPPKLWAANYTPAPIGYGTTEPTTSTPVATGLVMERPASMRSPNVVKDARGVNTDSPHAEEQAAVAEMTRQGLVKPPTTAPVNVVPDGLAAAIAALTPEQRAQMGIPS